MGGRTGKGPAGTHLSDLTQAAAARASTKAPPTPTVTPMATDRQEAVSLLLLLPPSLVLASRDSGGGAFRRSLGRGEGGCAITLLFWKSRLEALMPHPE